MIRGRKHLLCLGQKDLTLLGEPCSLLSADEERDSNLVFQIGNLFADGGLGNVQLAGAAAESVMLGYRTEIAQMTQLHCSSLSVFPMAIN
jgi:hypothetical protein